MKSIIYYFTGTGNSLAAARKIAAAIPDCSMVPIASLKDTGGVIRPEAKTVGIVCPVYDFGVPRIVAGFAERLDLSSAGYTFAVLTMGGMGVSALHQLDGILKSGHGRGIDGGFAVRMPGNFPPLYHPPEGAKKEKILAAADEELEAVAKTIAKKILAPPGFSPFSSLLKHFIYPPFFNNVGGMDKDFSVSDACTSCGTCASICPKGNIVLENGKPRWQHRCELCCACLHFCPKEAIDLSVFQGTKGRGRYRHPDVKVSDMKAQREEQAS